MQSASLRECPLPLFPHEDLTPRDEGGFLQSDYCLKSSNDYRFQLPQAGIYFNQTETTRLKCPSDRYEKHNET